MHDGPHSQGLHSSAKIWKWTPITHLWINGGGGGNPFRGVARILIMALLYLTMEATPTIRKTTTQDHANYTNSQVRKIGLTSLRLNSATV